MTRAATTRTRREPRYHRLGDREVDRADLGSLMMGCSSNSCDTWNVWDAPPGIQEQAHQGREAQQHPKP